MNPTRNASPVFMIKKLTHLCRRHVLTLVQMQSRLAKATPAYKTAADPMDAAEQATAHRRVDAQPVVAGQGNLPGVLVPTH